MLPVISYGCETWSLTLREENKGIWEQNPENNRTLQEGTARLRMLHLRKIFPSSKSREDVTVHVTCMEEKKNRYSSDRGKFETKKYSWKT
jgi:hypothetical protein